MYKLASKVIRSDGFEAADKAVLIVLADAANREGHAWPSLETMQRRTGLSERTVRRSLRRLEQAEWLKREGTHYRNTVRYRISNPVTVAPLKADEPGHCGPVGDN